MAVVSGMNHDLVWHHPEGGEWGRKAEEAAVCIGLPKVRRMTKARLWKTYHELNRAKVWIMVLHLRAAPTRREKKLLEYLENAWARAEHLGWDDHHVIYMAVIPYCSFEYVGESILGLEQRLQTHLTLAARKGSKQRVYGKMRSLGPHRARWLVLESYPNGSTKFHRLFREGLHIWNRDAKLNVLGGRTWRGDRSAGGAGEQLIKPKLRRFKLVKRLRELHRRGVEVEDIVEKDRRKQQEALYALTQKGKVMSMIGRLARRPLHKQAGFKELGIAKQVRELEGRQLASMVKQGHRILDGANQSIFMSNVAKITSDQANVVITTVQVKSSLNVETEIEKACSEEVYSLSRRWARKGVAVFVRAMVGTRSARTVTSIYGNTTKWGGKGKEEFTCPCQRVEYAGMERVEGHICQPIMPWLEAQGVGGGAGWNAKTACRPSVGRELEKVVEAIDTCNQRIWRKILRKKVEDGMRIDVVAKEVLLVKVREAVLQEKIKLVWERNEEKWRGCVEEDQLWRLKAMMDGLVNCPIDKHNAEAIAL